MGLSQPSVLTSKVAEGTVLCVKGPAEVVTAGTWETGPGENASLLPFPHPSDLYVLRVEKGGRGK